MTVEEIDLVAADFLDGEIVDLASDWLGNTVSFVCCLRVECRLKFASFQGRAKAFRKVFTIT